MSALLSIIFWLLFMQISVIWKLQEPTEKKFVFGLRVTSRGGRVENENITTGSTTAIEISVSF